MGHFFYRWLHVVNGISCRDAAGVLNAVADIRFKQAMTAAAAVDARVRAGESDELPALAGVPVSIKDSVHQAGHDTTIGIATNCFKPRDEDSLLVEGLVAAGAIPFVRSTVPALLLLPDTVSNVFGQTLNPWDLGRVPGGSSGGEAALVAARASPLGLGKLRRRVIVSPRVLSRRVDSQARILVGVCVFQQRSVGCTASSRRLHV
jgi:Asp-tRNA(Asn)/Glu-tRNA(Gln) amidotransferase A subunit family amidase